MTLTLVPVRNAVAPFDPGQFMMLAAPGVGEVAISASGDPDSADLQHTIRAVGAVSRALHDTAPGSIIGVRGPFGVGWGLDACAGRDVVIVAGGVGLAAVRAAVLGILAHRDVYRRVTLVVGARSPGELLYRSELEAWGGCAAIDLAITVDQPRHGWRGAVGFVTEPLARLSVDPDRTSALLCGPEPMMRFCARVLIGKRVPAPDIRVSLERNMQCGIAVCGHCQLGELLLCRDGPVIDYTVAGPLLQVREL